MVLTLLAFFGFLVIYSLRVNLSVALVAMVNYTATHPQNITENATDRCGKPIHLKHKDASEVGVAEV